MSVIGSKRMAPPPRKASPPRESVTNEELTFRAKLEEIKRMRVQGAAETSAPTVQVAKRLQVREEPVVPKQVQTVNGVKTFLKGFGDWVEVVSKSGKVYYYNKKTRANQWSKPEEWIAEEMRLNPPLPPPLPEVVKPPEPEDPSQPQVPRIKMKLKAKKKVGSKKNKNPEAHLPLAYQSNPIFRTLDSSDDEDKGDNKEDSTNDRPQGVFDDGSEEQDGLKLTKLDNQDEIGHIKLPTCEPDVKNKETTATAGAAQPTTSTGNGEQQAPPPSIPKKPLPGTYRKFDPTAGPKRIEMLAEGSAAALAYKNITSRPENEVIYGENALGLSNTALKSTFFTEYNLPCCLRRCKFPKEQDVLHELKINSMKKRNYMPTPLMTGLDPKLAYLAEEAEMEALNAELKDYAHHDRLLTARMGSKIVYKIPDEVWERYFSKFQIKIFDGVFLECRPSGYSHNDELIYSRTGKTCGRKTFPEDEVRCQALIQAWKKDSCLCIYANKIFTIERDDRQWDSDLSETRRFLEKHGY